MIQDKSKFKNSCILITHVLSQFLQWIQIIFVIITATNTFGVFITPTMRINLSINMQIHILGTNYNRIVSQ